MFSEADGGSRYLAGIFARVGFEHGVNELRHMKTFLYLALVAFILSSGSACRHVASAEASADLVIRNARVITVNPNQPSAEAIAVRGEKIVFVGSNGGAEKFIGTATRVVDAKGRTVLPGLYDSHVHSYRAAVSEMNGGAPFIRSIAEAQRWIRDQAAARPPGSWIILERVYATRLQEGRLPTKAELDQAAPNNPVHWNSGPVSVANSKALELSGITRATANPTPGEIVRDVNGEPTGLLRNAAQLLKGASSAFKPTAAEQRAAVKQLHARYNQQGITSIGERRTEFEAIDLFRDLAKSGELTVRINCTRMMEPVPKTIDDALKKLDELTFGAGSTEQRTANVEQRTGNYGPTGAGDDWVRIGPLKVLLDGGMLIGTAYMREPWGVSEVYQITDPNYRGLLNVKPEILNLLYLEAARRGWQLAAHCTGEASPDVLLDCYENIHAKMNIRDRRFLVTHANFQFSDSLQRFKRMGISADVQPAWLYKDGASLRLTLGERRMQSFQPWKTCFAEGICIGGGSDHMVQLDSFDSTNPWNPWLGMWIAVTRQTERGGVDKPEQRLSREQALQLYTINNAYLNFEERKKGSLEPGKLADLIMIDRDVLSCPADDIKQTKVVMTIVGGKTVWQQR